MHNDIPMLAGIALHAFEIMNVIQIQKDHITGVQGTTFTVEHVVDGAFEDVENLIKLVLVHHFIAIFCNFRIKGMLRCGHPVIQDHVIQLPTSLC